MYRPPRSVAIASVALARNRIRCDRLMPLAQSRILREGRSADRVRSVSSRWPQVGDQNSRTNEVAESAEAAVPMISAGRGRPVKASSSIATSAASAPVANSRTARCGDSVADQCVNTVHESATKCLNRLHGPVLAGVAPLASGGGPRLRM
ncbi:hypothetical protein GCM10023321_73310 [Pseudonocardia eucalypti]|uniref:Uncharacterized protein n=1 Tax=Pseudonocardia eucalypti TaxID=648755 RepID=A0ABP9R8H8_9PSEU